MFIRDIRRDFYNIVVKKKILLLVSFDVDAVCALRILQFLFETDNVQYTAIPVSNVADCVRTYTAHSSNIDCLILLNVGLAIAILVGVPFGPSVDADELTGLCYVGNQRTDTPMVFVIVPSALYLVLGSFLLLMVSCKK